MRPPLQGVWRLDQLSSTLVPLALVELLLGMVMLASPRAFWGYSVLWFTVMTLVTFSIAFLFSFELPRLVAPGRNPTLTSRVAFALLILGWGPFMAFHVEHIPGINTLYISVMPQLDQLDAGFHLNISFLVFLQMSVIGIAGLFATISLWRIWAHAVQQGCELVRWRWGILAFICILYLVAAIKLVAIPENYL